MRVFITRQERENIEILKEGGAIHVKAPYYSSLCDIKRAVLTSSKEDNSNFYASKDKHFELQANSLYAANAHILLGVLLGVIPFEGFKTEIRDSQVLMPKKLFNSYETRRGELTRLTLNFAKDKLPQLLSAIGTKLSVCPKKMVISAGANDWFTSQNGKITLSPCVVMLPPLLQTYIVSKALLTSAGCDSKQIRQIVSINISNASKLSLALDQYEYIKDIYMLS